MDILELLKAVLFGIVEGITEWLPVSSTGHLILLDEFVTLNTSQAFKEMFEVVIQLGAILAVILLFFHKLNPFSPKKSPQQKKNTWSLWFKIVVAVIPSAVIGIPLNDWINDTLRTSYVPFLNIPWLVLVIVFALVAYGIVFLFIEKLNKRRHIRLNNVFDIDYRTAIFIGLFQCLSIIPGTSRSGSTILGALLLGVSRSAGAEFSFFLAIPTMVGASGITLLDFLTGDVPITSTELGVLIVGFAVSFLVSLLVIKGLMEFVRKHSFAAFGIYRIILGAAVMIYFLLLSL